MSDETIIRQVKRAISDSKASAPATPQTYTIFDFMKILPLIAVVIGGAIGYGALQTRVDRLELDRSEQRDMNKELWLAIRRSRE